MTSIGKESVWQRPEGALRNHRNVKEESVIRLPEPDKVKIYIRFHSTVDNAITEFAIINGMKRAAAVRFLFAKYIDNLLEK